MVIAEADLYTAVRDPENRRLALASYISLAQARLLVRHLRVYQCACACICIRSFEIAIVHVAVRLRNKQGSGASSSMRS